MMKLRLFAALTLALGLMFVLAFVSAARGLESSNTPSAIKVTPANTEFVPGEVIIKLRDGVTLSRGPDQSIQASSSSLNAALTRVGVRGSTPVFASSSSPDLRRVFRLQIGASADVLSAVSTLKADPDIEYAEPNYLARAAVLPNDPLYASQWALDKINAPSAWNVVTSTPGSVITIIDSGIDLIHPDLAGQLWTNPGEIAGNGIDDDNNGYIDDAHGWNFVANSNDVSDDNGHGTQVAGVAGAATNNALGIAGMCWNCRLMIVKAMQASGVANYSDIAAAVNYAASKGAKVINLSLGGYADSATLRAAIDAASSTAVIVGGAGNDNVSTPFYPAAYSKVLAVAATTISDTKASFSNYGAWVDVAAPGVSISTTFSGGDYGTSDGTSLSAPFVSGLAGLIKSLHSDWSPALLRAQIIHTTDAITDTQLGSGRINAANAMQAPRPLFSISGYSINGTPNGRPDPNSGDALIVNVSNDWLDATSVIGTLSESDPFVTIVTGTTSFGDIASSVTQSSAPFSFTVASSAGYNYPIAFTLNLSANGGAYTATLPLTITTRSGDQPIGPTTIAVNTVWTHDKTYIVNGNISVAPGVTLTIEPGTVIKFNGNYSLNIGGTLIADGTAAQPIRFESKTSATWNRINFLNTSAGVTVDANSDYLAGSILRHVAVDKAANGIVSEAIPLYLSHVNLSGGGVTVYTTTAYLFDNDLTGWISGGSFGTYAQRNAIHGTLSAGWLSTQGTVEHNEIYGWMVVNALVVRDNVVSGGWLDAGNAMTVTGNFVTGGSLSVSGPAVVLSNTVENSSGVGLSLAGNAIVRGNRLIGNGTGLLATSGEIIDNLIANSSGIGLQVGAATVLSNTFTGNLGSAIKIVDGLPTIHGNNFEGNLGAYDIEDTLTGSTSYVQVQDNWWGITDTSTIDQRIYDFNDGDLTISHVVYSPTLTGPAQDAPAYVRTVRVLPDTTLGIQTGTFEAEFSRPMDQSMNPVVTFGATASYTSFAVLDNAQWVTTQTWRATYDVTSLVPRGAYTISVSVAKGMDGMEIAPDTHFGFTVDYAGGVVDTTPPPAPSVTACGSSSANSLSARWSAHDPESAITLYRYAIGAAPGMSEVINWTTTTATSTVRSNLNLSTGQTYYISVQARNAGGLWSPVAASNGVVAGAGNCPTAAFIALPTSGPVPLTVQFTDSSSGTYESRHWDFGDGITSTLPNPQHIYTAIGTYSVTLQVLGTAGLDSLTRANYITVYQPVAADFSATPLSGTAPLTVTFTNQSTGDYTDLVWNFGDGITSTLLNPTHTYSFAGSYTVSLQASGLGGTAGITRPNYIAVYQPVHADFSATPLSGTAPLTVTFTNQSTGDYTDLVWNFGDGITSTLGNPTHVYAAGVYTVTLRVSGLGGTDVVTRSNYIGVSAFRWHVYLPVIQNSH